MRRDMEEPVAYCGALHGGRVLEGKGAGVPRC
jgi:hypothetical protein